MHVQPEGSKAEFAQQFFICMLSLDDVEHQLFLLCVCMCCWLQEVQALAAVGAHQNIVQYYSAWAEPDMQVCSSSTASLLAEGCADQGLNKWSLSEGAEGLGLVCKS